MCQRLIIGIILVFSSNISFAKNTNLWDHIADNYSLVDYDERTVALHRAWFEKNPDYLQRVTSRAAPYLYLIVDLIKKAKVPIEIALLPIVESAYQPFSYSPAGASGLWQFILSTGKLYGLESDYWYDGRRDIVRSTYAAIKYLQNLEN